MDRRPVQARQTRWAGALARGLAKAGFRPNVISLLSVFFATLSGLGLLLGSRSPLSWHITLSLLASLGIELRLLANLMDGMVAIEGGFQTRAGAVYNELPDRLSDSVILVCAGFSVPGNPWWVWALGWAAALLAMLTAYVRVLGGASGVSQPFIGPMAKQQRMHLVVAGALFSMAEAILGWPARAMPLVLGIIVLGAVLTVLLRVRRIVRELNAGPGP
jgi:phosphatidylglycerophosphate synthase